MNQTQSVEGQSGRAAVWEVLEETVGRLPFQLTDRTTQRENPQTRTLVTRVQRLIKSKVAKRDKVAVICCQSPEPQTLGRFWK